MANEKIIIAGGSGFIGKALSRDLAQTGNEVIILSRNPEKYRSQLDSKIHWVKWDSRTSAGWAEHVEGAQAIINLAGVNIAGGFWTASRKKAILASRLDAGKAIVDAIRQAKTPPQVVVQSSGIGIYGSRGDEILTEESGQGEGYLADVAKQWEASTKAVTELNVRQVILRIAVVLEADGGYLAKVKLPFYFCIGGHLGSGKQWLSWIHRKDLIEIIKFLIANPEADGAFNACAPEPIQAGDFFILLGKALKRPSWLHIPAFFLRSGLGEMADELLLPSQRCIPEKLNKMNFSFKYPVPEQALNEILKA